MLLRRERPIDVEAIDEVHRRAFASVAPQTSGEPVEVGLVRALRSDAGWEPTLSIVAEGPDGTVIGHVVATRGAVGDIPVLGLGPLGVLPERQRSGVGQALMHAVLAAADALDHPVVVLLGHVEYYPRFGFVPATSIGVTPPDPAWGDHFQARPLTAWHPGLRGEFRYARPFDEL
ncbi:MAG: GNAT family N-acetyltransferase [Acidimicrobiales bacterium]